MKVLQIRSFPVCCGAEVVGYFGWSKTNPNAAGPRNLTHLEEDLQELDKMKHVGARFLTLAEEQIPHVEHLLQKYEYVPLMKNFHGPGHGNNITLYGKVLVKGKGYEVGKLTYHTSPKESHGTAEKIPDKTSGTAKAPARAWGRATTRAAARPIW